MQTIQNPQHFHKTFNADGQNGNAKSLKLHSLKNKREFDFVFKNAFRFSNPAFSLYFLHFSFLKNGRNASVGAENRRINFRILEQILSTKAQVYLGLSVSKKVGHAPARNLLKRRARAIFSQADFRDFCIIFVPNEKIKELGFSQLESNFKKALGVAKGRLFGKAQNRNLCKESQEFKTNDKGINQARQANSVRSDFENLKSDSENLKLVNSQIDLKNKDF